MFSKLIQSTSRCTLSFSHVPRYFNSVSTTYPLLFKAFPNLYDASSSFVIKQLEEKELDEASACITEAFISREMITKNFKIQRQQMLEKVKKDLEKALESNLCLVCRDKSSNKLAGVVYYEDMTDTVDPKIWEADEENNENWNHLVQFYKHCFSMISPHAAPKERNDALMFKKLAVAQEFTKMGVASNLIFAGRYIHPRTTKAKKTLSIATDKKMCEFMMKHGWELINEIDVQEYKDASFAEQGVVYLMKYERQYVKTLIQELKSFFNDED